VLTQNTQIDGQDVQTTLREKEIRGKKDNAPRLSELLAAVVTVNIGTNTAVCHLFLCV
jgi:hypothetical protein